MGFIKHFRHGVQMTLETVLKVIKEIRVSTGRAVMRVVDRRGFHRATSWPRL